MQLNGRSVMRFAELFFERKKQEPDRRYRNSENQEVNNYILKLKAKQIACKRRTYEYSYYTNINNRSDCYG